MTKAVKGTFSLVVVGDNVDKTVKPRFMSSDRQRQSLHNFHSYAALDHIDFLHLLNNQPIAQMSGLASSLFLPTSDDCDVF